MKSMKALLSVFLIIAMLQIFVLNGSALVAQDMFDGREEVTESSPLSSEEKLIPCDATEDDDFADDTILIVMKHNNSMELSEYDVTDFSEINHLTKIDELSKHEKEKLKNEMKTKTEKYIDKITKTTCDSMTKTKAESLARNELSTKNPQFRSILKLTLNTHDKKTILDTIKKLELRDDILSAEPNYVTQLVSNPPNDYNSSTQWAVSNMKLPEAWNYTTGSRNVLVGVIDTGIEGNHEDLQANIYSDEGFHKSYVDSSPLIDTHGHGTHVAGIIGAVGNNSIGITGVCWRISLVSFKISTDGYSNIDKIISAIEDAKDLGIDLLNCSNSYPNASSVEQSLATYKGLFICSAGNQGVDIDNTAVSGVNKYPSLCRNTNIISVASINNNNTIAFDSCFGKTSIDLAAPGVEIRSTYKNGSYCTMSGTSMATPQVTGVAALIKSKLPSISPMGIKRAILDKTIYCSSVNGKVVTNGRLNALAAMQSAISSIYGTSYTINFDKGIGTGLDMPSKTVHFGAKGSLDSCTYQPPVGYRFAGWYAKNSGNKWEFLKPNGNIEWRSSTNSCSTSTIHLYPNGADDMDGITTISRSNGTTITMVAQYEPINYSVDYDLSPNLFHPTLTLFRINARYDNIYAVSNCVNIYNESLQKMVVVVNYNIYRNHNGSVEWLCYDTDTNNRTWSTSNNELEKIRFSRGSSFSNLTTIDGDHLFLKPNWALRGDVDYDGTITIMDATRIQRYLLNLCEINDDMLPVADFDEDDEVTILDATAIQSYIANS